MIKVTFVGAGSVEFTRNVATDLCGYPEFRGELHFSLYDISPERLAHAERLVRRISDQTGAAATVTATADRREALAGASYVINEVQVGGYAATRADFDIPAKYGVRQTIGDTLGIGGIFRGLRTIPVVVDLARDMGEVCPDAYLLSYSNPMAMLPWAAYEGGGFEPGLRPVPLGPRHPGLPDRAGRRRPGAGPLPHRRVQPPGLRAALRAGRRVAVPAAGEVDRVLARAAPPGPGRDLPPVRLLPDRVERALGRVRALVHAPRRPGRAVPHLRRRLPRAVGGEPARAESLERQLASDEPLELELENELASLFIHSLETGTERELHVNIRNGGLIASLPDQCCVEVPCLVGAAGPRPVPVGALPPQLAALNRTFLNVVELTVRAALDGSRDHVYQAALLDPNTGATLTTAQTVAMCDELLAAHRDLLPPALRSVHGMIREAGPGRAARPR